jgi:hypothetical protein
VQAEATGASRGLAEWTFAAEAGDGAFVVEVGGGGLIACMVVRVEALGGVLAGEGSRLFAEAL